MRNILTSWFRKHSLNFKLNISILTCVCFGFFCLILFISRYAEPIILSQSEHNAHQTVESYISDFTFLVSDTERIVLNTKNTLDQLSSTDVESLLLVLNSAIKTGKNSTLTFTNAWVYVFPPQNIIRGNLYSSINKGGETFFRSEKITNFYDHFPWFKAVPKREKIYWSEPYKDKNTGQVVVTCLVPFKFKNTRDFSGLVALTVDLSHIQESINHFSYYGSGKMLLLSRSGLYVTHPNPKIALKKTIFNLSDELHMDDLAFVGMELSKGNSGQIEIERSSLLNGKAILFYAPIGKLGWGICLVYSMSEYLKPIHNFQLIILLSFCAGAILLFFLISHICRKSTDQLITLSTLATQYGNGDFTENFEDNPSSSDIHVIANALSSMRENLLNYIEKERKTASDQQKNESELEIAHSIQKSALSVQYPRHEAFDISTLMIPAKQIGGDFYDFFFINENRFAFVIADVSGKGIPAALYMMKAQTLIKNACKNNTNLAKAIRFANNELCEGNDSCMFVTAFIAVVDLIEGVMTFVNAGHTIPLLYTKDKYRYLKPQRNIVLGARENMDFTAEKITLSSGDRFFVYTDGVTEAENEKAEFYGEQRLADVLQKVSSSPTKDLNTVLKDIKKFTKTAPQSDDIAMLEFVYNGFKTGSIVFGADLKNLIGMVNFLKREMTKNKLSEKAQFAMISAGEEIFSNIASYAYAPEENGTIKIKTFVKNDKFYASFSDSGRPYNPLDKKDPDISQDIKNREVGGLGVFLAKKLTDEISYVYKKGLNILTIGISPDK